jgi:hypothetical protein
MSDDFDRNARDQFMERVFEALEDQFDGAFPGTDPLISSSLTNATIDVQLGAVRFEVRIEGPFREAAI